MLKIIKKEPVLSIAWIAAIISMFFITPNKEYIGYIDFHTIALLFCLMCITCGLKNIGLFKLCGVRLLSKVKSTFQLEIILVLLCFFSSMLITNDVALITFVPFAIETMKMADKEDSLPFIIVLQTIAANLGSQATPIGNPQNIYIYSKYSVMIGEFFTVVLPYVILSFVLIIITVSLRKKSALKKINLENNENLDKKKAILYFLLFLLSVLSVAHIIPVSILTLIIVIVIFISDKKIFKDVDYILLFTFIGFFIFIGNLGKIDSFRQIISSILEGNEIITSIISSQFLSNVPTSLLLSGFTDNWQNLLIGVNIGGLGTIIASMASLISYKLYANSYPDKKGKYMLLFTLLNIIYLVIFIVFTVFIV